MQIGLSQVVRCPRGYAGSQFIDQNVMPRGQAPRQFGYKCLFLPGSGPLIGGYLGRLQGVTLSRKYMGSRRRVGEKGERTVEARASVKRLLKFLLRDTKRFGAPWIVNRYKTTISLKTNVSKLVVYR